MPLSRHVIMPAMQRAAVCVQTVREAESGVEALAAAIVPRGIWGNERGLCAYHCPQANCTAILPRGGASFVNASMKLSVPYILPSWANPAQSHRTRRGSGVPAAAGRRSHPLPGNACERDTARADPAQAVFVGLSLRGPSDQPFTPPIARQAIAPQSVERGGGKGLEVSLTHSL